MRSWRTWRPEDAGPVAIALDTLVAGVHFAPDAAPRTIGHKALAVNLSDLAAMGAAPRTALLHLAHPGPSARWEREFMAGFEDLAGAFAVRTERGPTRPAPLLVAVEVTGTFPGLAPPLRRSGARPGDAIYVTGTLGDAAGALCGARELASRLDLPAPRVAEGRALRSIASSAIDISDGLAADLGHVLAASGVGATLECARLPLSPALVAAHGRAWATDLALAGGDDYELAFTVPSKRERDLARARLPSPVTRIGTIVAGAGLRCLDENGEVRPLPRGYEHFEPRDPTAAPAR